MGGSGSLAALAGPIHADQLVRHFGVARNGGVNALRLYTKIRVEGAQYDTCVAGGSVLMKAEKVTAIVSHENPALGGRERQNLGVRHGGVRVSGIQRSDHVVPQPPQFRDDQQRNIFVGLETGYRLGGLVLANLSLNFPSVRAYAGPCIHQIPGAQ